jgi:cellulose synthase/poly-beta-1,6-N-acetylglucosamine synthase-like glycosyltransferase
MAYRKRSTRERLWEIIPGLSFWTVFFGACALSYFKPAWAALFIICFDLYWVLKAINVSIHLINAYQVFRVVTVIDWFEYLEGLKDVKKQQSVFLEHANFTKKIRTRWYNQEQAKRLGELLERGKSSLDYTQYYHMIIIPFVDESFEVLDNTLHALTFSRYPAEKLLVVLASEERMGEPAQEVARAVKEKYQSIFTNLFISVHPDGLEGEIKGKSANASWAVQSMLPVLEERGINTDLVLVSNFDSDTIVHPQYFARVMYEFLLAKNPYQCSFQPIAVYNNNIWDSPAFIRVVSVSNSFWQFTESSRPDRLRTFSSHTMTLKALLDVGFWRKDIINEDGYIYWQCYLKYNGDYHVVPLFIPISLDTCLADTTWKTLKNQYKQKRRWAYNVEYYPTLIPALIKSKAPFFDKALKMWQYVEGNFNWATASLLIFTMGLLPLYLGGNAFLESNLAFTLPFATQTLLRISAFFLVFSIYINLILLPPRPKKYGVWRSVMMYLQWLLAPITSLIFGSIPAIDAQTRLMLGLYMEFWVTPKSRKGENTALQMQEMQTKSAVQPIK